MVASKFHASTRKIIIESVKKNLTFGLACDYAKVCRTIFYEWIKRGEAEKLENIESDYTIFVDDLKSARAFAAQDSLEKIAKSGNHPKRWTAHAWLLERVHRSDYSQNGEQFKELEQKINDLSARLDKKKKRSVLKEDENAS